RGPGHELFDAVARELGPLPLVAENLGVITPAVERLRRDLELPGMVVLHFELPSRRDPIAVEESSVVYTGTHDTDTSLGWWQLTTAAARDHTLALARREGIDEPEPSWLLIRLALASRGRTAIVPVQDLLALDNSARMNTPGREKGNWTFRLEPGSLDAALARRLQTATRAARR